MGLNCRGAESFALGVAVEFLDSRSWVPAREWAVCDSRGGGAVGLKCFTVVNKEIKLKSHE